MSIGRTDAHADAVRAFVDVQEVADAVPSTVAEDILSLSYAIS